MTNEQMIRKTAIEVGLFTEEQVAAYLAAGSRLPLHTYAEWQALGFQVKRGEHAALKMQLWKPRRLKKDEKADRLPAPESGDDDTDGTFFLATSHLFLSSQVERIQQSA